MRLSGTPGDDAFHGCPRAIRAATNSPSNVEAIPPRPAQVGPIPVQTSAGSPICVNRGKRPAPPGGEPDLDLVTASRQTLQAWSLGVEDGELRLYVQSEAKKQKEDAILSAKRRRFEAELCSLQCHRILQPA